MLRRYHGWRRDTPDPRDVRMGRTGAWLRSLLAPKAVDLSTGRLPRVEVQDPLGSCVACGTTSAVEYVAIRDQHSLVELSRLWVYYATRVWIEHSAPTDDCGCEIRNAIKALARYGVPAEDAWPYDPPQFSVMPPRSVGVLAAHRRIAGYVRCLNLTSIKAALASGWPVVGGFSCPQSIEDEATTKSGIVALPQPGERIVGGHCVLFCGFDSTTKLLKFQNSWGRTWGQRGFGFLPFAYVTRGLADDFWFIQGVRET